MKKQMSTKYIDIPIKIGEPFSLECFHVNQDSKQYLEGILLPQGMIDSRVEKLAWNIASFYEDKPFLMLTVLKGAIHFSSMLTKFLANIYSLGLYNNSIRNEFIKVKSYLNDKSTGKVNISGMEGVPIEGKDILIVEDIIDSGNTMTALLEQLLKLKPKSIHICALVKRNPKYVFPVEFSGIDCDGKDYFIVGYGLDYNEHFRDFKHIGYLNNYGKEVLKNKTDE